MRKLSLFLLFVLAGAVAYVFLRRRSAEQSAPLYELAPLPGAPPASPAVEAALAAHAHDDVVIASVEPVAAAEAPDATPDDAAQAAHAHDEAADVVAPADIAADAAQAAHTHDEPAPADIVDAEASEAAEAAPAAGESLAAPLGDLSADDTTGTGYTSLLPEEVAEETASDSAPGVATVAPDGTELPDLPDDEPEAPRPPVPNPGERIDLNAATVDELIALPGIGPYLAQRIIDFRDARGGFKSVGDLLDISGIGPNNIREFEDYLSVSAPADEGSGA
jgi:competence protein ComEA